MKLSLSDLERVRKDRSSIDEHRQGFGHFPKILVLYLAVYKYHRGQSDLYKALTYFEEIYRSKFKHVGDIDLWLNRLVEYDGAYKASQYLNFKVKYRTKIICGDIQVTGEIPRLDMDKSGEREYAAWLFTRGSGPWRDELRMPLIQAQVALQMHVPSNGVSIGVYNFDTGFYDRECFDRPTIERAQAELTQLAVDINRLNS